MERVSDTKKLLSCFRWNPGHCVQIIVTNTKQSVNIGSAVHPTQMRVQCLDTNSLRRQQRGWPHTAASEVSRGLTCCSSLDYRDLLRLDHRRKLNISQNDKTVFRRRNGRFSQTRFKNNNKRMQVLLQSPPKPNKSCSLVKSPVWGGSSYRKYKT